MVDALRHYAAVARHAKLKETDPAKIAEIVHARTRPIGARERVGWAARFDTLVSRIAAWAVLTSFQTLGLEPRAGGKCRGRADGLAGENLSPRRGAQ